MSKLIDKTFKSGMTICARKQFSGRSRLRLGQEPGRQ